MGILVNNKGQPCICQGSNGLLVKCGGECSCWPVSIPAGWPNIDPKIPRELKVEFGNVKLFTKKWKGWGGFGGGSIPAWYWNTFDFSPSDLNKEHCLELKGASEWGGPSYRKEIGVASKFEEIIDPHELRETKGTVYVECVKEDYGVDDSPFWIRIVFVPLENPEYAALQFYNGSKQHYPFTPSYWNESSIKIYNWFECGWSCEYNMFLEYYIITPRMDLLYGGWTRFTECKKLDYYKRCRACEGFKSVRMFKVTFHGLRGCENSHQTGGGSHWQKTNIRMPRTIYLKPASDNSCTFVTREAVGLESYRSRIEDFGLVSVNHEDRQIWISLIIERSSIRNRYILCWGGWLAYSKYGDASYHPPYGFPPDCGGGENASSVNGGTLERADLAYSGPGPRFYGESTSFVCHNSVVEIFNANPGCEYSNKITWSKITIEPIEKLVCPHCLPTGEVTETISLKIVDMVLNDNCINVMFHFEKWEWKSLEEEMSLYFEEAEPLGGPCIWKKEIPIVGYQFVYDTYEECYYNEPWKERNTFPAEVILKAEDGVITLNIDIVDPQTNELKKRIFYGSVTWDKHCPFKASIENRGYLRGTALINGGGDANQFPSAHGKASIPLGDSPLNELERRKAICEDCPVSRCLENDTLACTKIDARRPCKLTEQQKFGECPEGKW